MDTNEGRCWLAWSEFVPLEVWKRLDANPRALDLFTTAFRDSLLPQIPSDWNPDVKAHHGPIILDETGHQGVIFVLRAWRRAPTDSGSCDGTCEMCERGRSSFMLTGVA